MVTGILAILVFALFPFCRIAAQENPTVSGSLVGGFRVLPIGEAKIVSQFFVYRGDYIKFDIGNRPGAVLSIPALDIESQLTPDQEPFFKMKKTGVFDTFIGDFATTLTVMEYKGAHYRAVSAREGWDAIGTFSPLILDVRTPKEYNRAHLEGAVLIPVQTLQKRLSEIAAHKDDPILIYCATGNRSTVASKILIDRGFSRIFNLRYGIADWYRKKYPIVK